jgi:hypothetical protein
MKKRLRLLLLTPLTFSMLAAPVLAQSEGSTDLLPLWLRDLFEQFAVGGYVPFITGRVQLVLILMLTAVIVAAVIYSIIAAFKYISSQGDSGKIEEAQKAIKAIFLGIGAMFVSIIGIVIIFAIFGVSLPPTKLYRTCEFAIDSEGCRACTNDSESALCKLCEAGYELNEDNPDAVDSRCRE